MTVPKYSADDLKVWEAFAAASVNAITTLLCRNDDETYADNAAVLADMMMVRRNERKAT